MKFLPLMPRWGTRIALVLTLFSPLAQGQTCVAGIQPSNPMSVYAVDSINGTATDTRTGLMWDRCARGLSGADCATGTAVTLNWQDALDSAAAIGTYKGYSDWRLPNVKELRSLVEECRGQPAINEFAFPNAPASTFWSSSPEALVAANAWIVSFASGGNAYDPRVNSHRIRLVRGGQ